MVALQPFSEDDIKSRFARIANDNGVLHAAGIGHAPRNLVRQFVDHRGGIEFGGGADTQHARETYRRHEVTPAPVGGLHGFLRLLSWRGYAAAGSPPCCLHASRSAVYRRT